MLQPREFKELRKPEGYPRKIESLGDHVRARGLELGLTQNEAANVINVGLETILGWEKNMALELRKPSPSLIHYSDRGSNYTSREYRQALADQGIQGSMSRQGSCWDNAVAESLFATIKEGIHSPIYICHKARNSGCHIRIH